MQVVILQEPNFRAEANRIITDLLNLPEDMRRNDLQASLVAMYSSGYDAGQQSLLREPPKKETKRAEK